MLLFCLSLSFPQVSFTADDRRKLLLHERIGLCTAAFRIGKLQAPRAISRANGLWSRSSSGGREGLGCRTGTCTGHPLLSARRPTSLEIQDFQWNRTKPPTVFDINRISDVQGQRSLTFVVISDTHDQHSTIALPDADVLLHWCIQTALPI